MLWYPYANAISWITRMLGLRETLICAAYAVVVTHYMQWRTMLILGTLWTYELFGKLLLGSTIFALGRAGFQLFCGFHICQDSLLIRIKYWGRWCLITLGMPQFHSIHSMPWFTRLNLIGRFYLGNIWSVLWNYKVYWYFIHNIVKHQVLKLIVSSYTIFIMV